MNKTDKIYIAGHTGMVGSAILRKLKSLGCENFCIAPHEHLDLTNQEEVNDWFYVQKPDYVFLCAAKVGGILANKNFKADFIYNNLMIQSNVISAAWEFQVKKLLFLGSSCMYPKDTNQPMNIEQLMTGRLEPTNDSYAVAKLAGLKMCQAHNEQYQCNFIAAIPCNLYGTNDNYDLEFSHVIPAMIRKFVEAKDKNQSHVVLWGDGTPLREFMHVDDLADACIFLMQNYNDSKPINVGTGSEITISRLAELICNIIGYKGKITYNKEMPNGTPRKVMDNSKIRLMGWNPKINITYGLKQTIEEYKAIYENNLLHDSAKQ